MANETKITYATLSADDDEMHRRFDAAISRVKAELGRTTPLYIGGKARPTAETTATTSPADTRVEVARVAAGTAQDVHDAVAAAKAAYPCLAVHALAEAHRDPRRGPPPASGNAATSCPPG